MGNGKGLEGYILGLYIGIMEKKMETTLPETNMETQKGPYEDYSPSKRGYMSFHVSLGECTL